MPLNRVKKEHTLALTECWASEKNTSRLILAIRIRGGVEDTRLKAKDTKKIRGQGQGQPFRRQNLSRPRTGMLKDRGHMRKRSPKKKGF